MKIVFISNFYNHHQKPVADELYSIIGSDYYFIETQKISEARLSMGWGRDEKPTYVLQNYLDQSAKENCQRIIDEADVVIIGSAPRALVETRLKNKKLTFYYSERPYKIKPPFYKIIVHFLRNLRYVIRHRNLYILCSSAYTAADYKKVGTFINKAYKWGYFTEAKYYDDVDNLIKNKLQNSILWVSRFIPLKHPEHIIEVAKRLKNDGYSVKISMIGTGELEGAIKELIKEENLEDYIEIYGSMKPQEVREHMEKNELFLFTSDRNEGWGAVLNESMNSACAVVANSAIGSVPFLIKHGENGYMYKDGDVEELYRNVKMLLDNSNERKRISKNAYKMIIEEYNPQNAAKKFVQLCEIMLNGEYKPFPFKDGVCSKAEELKDNWYK